MKMRTVGVLAGAAMMLTSLTVWSVTPAGGFGDRVVDSARSDGFGVDGPTAALTPWKFESGNTLVVEGRLGHHTLASSKDSETFMLLNVKAPDVASAATSAQVNLAIAIDRSGSMSGRKLQNAIEAARGMVRRLRDGDVVSVIAYNSRSETLVPSTTINASSRDEVVRRIAGISANGDTCISCAIESSMDALRSRDGMVKRMLLLSDGQATTGVRDLPGFRSLAERARAMGCSISSVGVDVDYNERVMSALALESNGRHYFVENSSGLSRIFDQELQSLVRTVATGGELRLELAPGVQVQQVYDRTFRREGNTLVVPMGAFTQGDQKTLLVKVRVPRGAEGMRGIADVKLSYTDLVNGGLGASEGKLLASLSSDESQLPALDPLVAGRVGRAETASTLREANQLFAGGNIQSARAKLSKKRDDIRRRRGAFASRAPAKRKAELDDDFDRQLAALGDAEDGFAAPPPAAASPGAPLVRARPANESRSGKAQQKRNQSAADAFAF
jgi:Ca-activated chloride channel family protein